jgi:hypothetical protein
MALHGSFAGRERSRLAKAETMPPISVFAFQS